MSWRTLRSAVRDGSFIPLDAGLLPQGRRSASCYPYVVKKWGIAAVVLAFTTAASAQTWIEPPSASQALRDAHENASKIPSPTAAAPAASLTPYKYPAPHRVDIDEAALGNCFALVTEKYGHAALLRDDMNKSYSAGAFFHYLHADPARSGDYSTGREEALKRWILSQPDDSIDPVSLYAESLNLNSGNVWNALLAIHQLVRNYARYFDTNAYFSDVTESEAAPFFDKFIDIRGDLHERSPKLMGDHRGTWYRIWGMMSYRLAQEPESRDMIGHGASATLEYCRDAKCSAVATLAEWVKPVMMFPEKDSRKAEVNREAAGAADALIDALYANKVFSADDALRCAERKYLSSPVYGSARGRRPASR